MSTPQGPSDVIWDITYACPLRCVHCYSESGRRPARQLNRDEMLRAADAIVSLRPQAVEFAGGEPLLVRDLLEVAGRISGAGVAVNLYTGGWTFDRRWAEEASEIFSRITVSVDGASAGVHDRIRGRAGSYERAMRTLAILDDVSGERVARGADPVEFGVDYAVVRSNLHELEEFSRAVAPRFPNLRFLTFAAAVPSGLASRKDFAEHELLDFDRLRTLVSREHVERLRSLAPRSVQLMTSNNMILMMHPELVKRHGFPMLQVEPDGEVRAMPIYEGTVGSLLTEDAGTLWERVQERWSDPFVVETLSAVRSMQDWAEATRRLDYHFGTDEVRRRIDRRPPYTLDERTSGQGHIASMAGPASGHQL
ncbi:radical SAM protein [Nonomuraea wenchangensis]|uniref:Radical SAM superfamily enzyme, MoaA/NifB/PqqE/SkfB family n=1 Tax=Nonomuraea wenchangensis TaxID=568860 RepID=A0A1I0LNQ5_9ACTN|nr:radical SAM protein [Nonomuraea wenchangensis]SEU43134.1 Radical SAM superfamily enzyme, MoaA/NifB/PqqE/SkfB family [Nonomuraea wenchangensis]